MAMLMMSEILLFYINLETNKTYKGTSHNSLRNAIKIAKRDCLNDLKDS